MTSSEAPDDVPPLGEGDTSDIDMVPDREDDVRACSDGDHACSDDDIMEFLDGTKEGEDLKPGKDEALGAVARHTSAQAAKTKTLVEELQEHLLTSDVHGKIRRFVVPPEYQAVFAGATIERGDKDWFVQTADWFKATVDRYKSGMYDPSVVDQDILRLQAAMVYFAAWVNHLDGVATDAESTLKQATGRAYLESRQWLEQQGVHPRAMNSEMLSAIALEAVSDRSDYRTTAKVTAETIKGFYFALKDFIMYLDRVSQRAQPDRLRERHR